MADKVAKGRQTRGETSKVNKLTEADVIELRRLRALGVKLRELADQFGLHITGAGLIARRVNWKHVR